DIGAPWLPTKAESPLQPNALTRGIELADFEHRALTALRDNGKYGNLAVAQDGQLLFTFIAEDGAPAIKVLNFKEGREAKTVLKGTGDFRLSANGKKALVRQGDNFALLDPSADQK